MDLIEQIIEDLTEELNMAEGKQFNAALLQSKVNAAYREVKAARKYPSTYNSAVIENDMENYYSAIRNLAFYDYTKIGAEGQTQYSADGASIHYEDRNKYFNGIDAIAR